MERDTRSIVHMALYVTRDEMAAGPRECFVGYDRFDNVVATTPRREAAWVAQLLERNSGWVQTHPSAPSLVADKIAEGERLRRPVVAPGGAST